MSYHKSLGGVGWVSLVPGGNYPDPIHLAEIEGFDLDIAEDQADLENSDGDVIDSFTTKRTVSGTITLKDFSNSLLAVVTGGVTITANRPIGYSYSVAIPTTPFEVTVPLTTPTRTFGTDLGVIDLTTGKMMTCDATASGTNVYMLDTGTGKYTFNTADSTHNVLINYRATPSTADGTTAAVAAASTGAAKYGLHCYNTKASKSWGVYVPQALIPGISAKFSKTAWSATTLKWKATLDSSNKLIYTYSPE